MPRKRKVVMVTGPSPEERARAAVWPNGDNRDLTNLQRIRLEEDRKKENLPHIPFDHPAGSLCLFDNGRAWQTVILLPGRSFGCWALYRWIACGEEGNKRVSYCRLKPIAPPPAQCPKGQA